MQKVSDFSFCTAKKEKKIFLKADFDVETKCGTELLAVGRWGWITWCVTVSSAPSLPVRRGDIAFCVCVCTHTRLAWEKATSTECLCLTCSVSPCVRQRLERCQTGPCSVSDETLTVTLCVGVGEGAQLPTIQCPYQQPGSLVPAPHHTSVSNCLV